MAVLNSVSGTSIIITIYSYYDYDDYEYDCYRLYFLSVLQDK